MRLTFVLLIVTVESVVACTCRSSAPRPLVDRLTEHPWMSSAVSPQEGIIGRFVTGGRVRLLTTGHRIVTLDVSRRRFATVPLTGIADDEDLMGFAGLPDGSLWTLSGWTTLLQVNEEGRVVARRSFGKKHTGLHAGFGRLIFQPLDFAAGTPVLVAGIPGEGEAQVWGAMRVREGNEAGPVRLAQSLASCGAVVSDRMPCWVSNSSAVELIDRAGGAETVGISALAAWEGRDPMVFASQPFRVIRDVWLEEELAFWILVRAQASDAPDRRGEHGLWNITRHGTVAIRYVLPSGARVIVGVGHHRVFLLTAAGDVVWVEV